MSTPSKQSEMDQRAAEAEAIQNCEREPIELIGTVQPFGALLAVDPESDRIKYVSANIADWLGHPPEAVLGGNMRDFFSRELIHQRNNALGHSTIEEQREVLGTVDTGVRKCEVFGHVRQGLLLVELQPAAADPARSAKTIDEVHRCLTRLSRKLDLDPLLQTAVDELRHYSGSDRVKAYRFLADGAGEVVAESRQSGVDSFLGLRFPAFDIPQSARNLYAKTPIRVIASVTAPQVPLLGEEQPGEALDLSLALLRGVVPVHVMYLDNMGIKASLSLPIVVDGKMWGLFAFHQQSERMPDAHLLSGLEMLGRSLSMMVSNVVQQAKLAAVRDCARVAPTLFVPDDSPLGFKLYWKNAASGLASLLPCDGVALVSGEKVHRYGACPADRIIAELLPEFEKLGTSNLFATGTLKTHFPDLDLGGSAGVLALLHPADSVDGVLFFRNASSTQVQWAGNPVKTLESSSTGSRLHPRGSFAAYQDESVSTSDAFVENDLMVAESLSAALAQALARVDVQVDQRKRMGLVIRELNHRARNILALARSMVKQTQASAKDMEAFVQGLVGRFEAMSDIQSLLTEQEWKHVDLRALVSRGLGLEKAPFAPRISLQGPGVGISPDLASLLSMIMHELLSNAMKYGALSTERGRVLVTWQMQGSNLHLEWVERGGPVVQQTGHQGFGSALILEALTYEFQAQCTLEFEPRGVAARFVIPLTDGENETAETYAPPVEAFTLELRPFNALVLEDDYVISREAREMLKELGASDVQAVSTIEGALEQLGTQKFDFILLDANIHGQFSEKAALRCVELGVPFAFATGYGSKDQQLHDLGGVGVLTKPMQKTELMSVLLKAGLSEKQH